jgi:hypothetical protein
MKRFLVCVSMLSLMLIAACSIKQVNSASESVSLSDSASSVDYAKSEKLEYSDEFGKNPGESDKLPEYIPNPWKDYEDTKEEIVPHSSETNGYFTIMVPTYIKYYDGLYFIVDCYHDQVVFTDDYDKPIYEWKVMDKDLTRPHTIASDGEVYMVDDTENKRILAYIKHTEDDGEIWFERIQEFVDMGERPHYVIYDETDGCFYAWSSMSGQMWVFKRSKDDKKVFLDASYSIPDLNGVYVRSFYFEDDKAYFVSGVYGNGTIYETTRDTFDVIREIPVAPEIGGMVQITKIQDYYYVTSSTSLYGETNLRFVVRTDSLEHLMMGQFEDVTDKLVGTEFPGTPYNITSVGDEWFLSIHRDSLGSPFVRFKVTDNEITEINGVQ